MKSDDSHRVPRGDDRRARPTSLLGAVLGRNRRAAFRRAGEGRDQYVDRLRRQTVLLVLGIIVACALDAFFTLVHLDDGALEANPLMAMAIRRGDQLFLGLKITVTIIGVWLLAVHQNFRMGLRGLQLVAVGYGLLIAYHLLLFIL